MIHEAETDHKYVCIKEITVRDNTIPKGAIVDRIAYGGGFNNPAIRFKVDGINYALLPSIFYLFFDMEDDE